MIASSTRVLGSLGFPSDLAAARAKPVRCAGDPRTTEVFGTIVKDTFAPQLKLSGFKNTRNVWTRRRDPIRAVIDIQRNHSTGDLLEFTSNWYIRIEGFSFGRERDVAVSGRIGNFLDAGEDHWWSIQLGRLARHYPTVVADSASCHREIAEGLRRTIAWLDDVDTVTRLIAALEPDEPPEHFHARGPSSLLPVEQKRALVEPLQHFQRSASAP